MATTKLSDSGTLGNKYENLSADNNYMETIASTVVGVGGVSTVTFSNIPQGYKHLQIRGFANNGNGTGGSTATTLRFNSDTGSNYAYHNLIGNGTATSSGAVASTTAIFVTNAPQLSATASAFGFTIIDILDYTNTNKYKTIKTLHGADLNGSGQIILSSGLWMNTSAITSITINPGGDAVQYTHFALYGIKG